MALLAASASATLPGPVRSEPSTTIRIGGGIGDSNSEPYFGLECGAFAQAGLNVDVQTFNGGGIMLQACAGGAIDVGIGDVIQVTSAINAGIPLAIFAGSALYLSDAPTTVLVVAKDGPVQSAKDLIGKTIAVTSLNSLQEISTREWLHQHGGDPARTTFVEMPGTGMIESVLHGSIAAAVPGNTNLAVEGDRAQNLRYLGKPFDVVAKTFVLSSFYARRDWLGANADAARRLVGAIYATARWSNEHHVDTARVLVRNQRIDPAVAQRMTRAQYATSLDLGMLQPIVDIAAKYKAVKQPIAAADLVVKFN
jgi:NitT/TauT family transport system substrate-binding protein